MTNYLRRSFRRWWLIATLFSMPVLMFAQQPQERLVKKFAWPGEPVQIVALEVDGKDVDFGNGFQAGEDWLRGLTLSIKNVSDKTVCWINIAMDINPESRGHGSRDRLLYGGRPSNSPERDGQHILRPGESVDIHFPAKSYKELKAFMKEKNYPGRVDAVKFSVDEVGFTGERNVLWIAGQLNRRDPNNPRRMDSSKPRLGVRIEVMV